MAIAVKAPAGEEKADAELVAAAQAGDARAAQALFVRY